MATNVKRQGENEFLSLKIGTKWAPLGCNNQFNEKVSIDKEDLNCQANGTKRQSFPGTVTVEFDVSGTYLDYTSPDNTTNWTAEELKAAAISKTEVQLIVTSDLEPDTVGTAHIGYIYSVDINRENGKPTKYQLSFGENSSTSFTIPE